jgi:hypothetical protein
MNRVAPSETVRSPEPEGEERPGCVFLIGQEACEARRQMNLVPARVVAEVDGGTLALEDSVHLPAPPGLEIGRSLTLALRPEHFEWRPGPREWEVCRSRHV